MIANLFTQKLEKHCKFAFKISFVHKQLGKIKAPNKWRLFKIKKSLIIGSTKTPQNMNLSFWRQILLSNCDARAMRLHISLWAHDFYRTSNFLGLWFLLAPGLCPPVLLSSYATEKSPHLLHKWPLT